MLLAHNAKLVAVCFRGLLAPGGHCGHFSPEDAPVFRTPLQIRKNSHHHVYEQVGVVKDGQWAGLSSDRSLLVSKNQLYVI